MRNHEWARALLLGLGLLLGANGVAAQSDNQAPVKLQADRAELDNTTGVSVYTGNVELTRGDTVITGDRMEVYTTDERRLQRVIVTGTPATYRGRQGAEQRLVRGRAPRMIYHVTGTERVEMLQGATLLQGDNRFEGQTIVYRVQADTVEADSGEGGDDRIRITLFPEENDGGDGETEEP